jgi:hypothetical protein
VSAPCARRATIWAAITWAESPTLYDSASTIWFACEPSPVFRPAR